MFNHQITKRITISLFVASSFLIKPPVLNAQKNDGISEVKQAVKSIAIIQGFLDEGWEIAAAGTGGGLIVTGALGQKYSVNLDKKAAEYLKNANQIHSIAQRISKKQKLYQEKIETASEEVKSYKEKADPALEEAKYYKYEATKAFSEADFYKNKYETALKRFKEYKEKIENAPKQSETLLKNAEMEKNKAQLYENKAKTYLDRANNYKLNYEKALNKAKAKRYKKGAYTTLYNTHKNYLKKAEKSLAHAEVNTKASKNILNNVKKFKEEVKKATEEAVYHKGKMTTALKKGEIFSQKAKTLQETFNAFEQKVTTTLSNVKNYKAKLKDISQGTEEIIAEGNVLNKKYKFLRNRSNLFGKLGRGAMILGGIAVAIWIGYELFDILISDEGEITSDDIRRSNLKAALTYDLTNVDINKPSTYGLLGKMLKDDPAIRDFILINAIAFMDAYNQSLQE